MKLTKTLKDFKNNIIYYFSNKPSFQITDIAFKLYPLNTSASNYYTIPGGQNNIYIPIRNAGDNYDGSYFSLLIDNPIANKDKIISLYIPVYKANFNFAGVRFCVKFNNSNANCITLGSHSTETHLCKIDIKNAEILAATDIGKVTIIT